MRSLFRVLVRAYRRKAIVLVLICLGNALGLLSPLLMGWLVTELGRPGGCRPHDVFLLLGVIAAVSFCSLSLGWFQNAIQSKASAEMLRRFRQTIWDHVVQLPLPRLYQESPSVWMQKICGDTATVCQSFQMLAFSALNFTIFMIGTAGLVFRKEPRLILVFVAALLVGGGLHRLFRSRIMQSAREVREESYAFNAGTFDTLILYPLVRMFRLVERFNLKFANASKRLSERGVRSDLVSGTYQVGLQIEMTGVHLVVLSACIILYLHGHIALGEILAFDMLIGQLSGGINNLLSSLPQLDQGLESGRLLSALLKEAGEGACESAGADSDGVLSISRLSFAYKANGRQILKDVSAKIDEGEYVCCCGGNGSGKTTLLGLAMGILKPTGGSVSLRAKRPVIIPQRVVVFRDTVLENVRLLDETIPRKKVESELRACGLGAWLDALENGLDTKISCDHVSGGELQRIGVARALVRDPDFLVVDELANNLDIVEKENIENLVQSLRGRCTVLAVTHDMESIVRYDKVWILSNGRIAEIEKGDGLREKVEQTLHEILSAKTCH